MKLPFVRRKLYEEMENALTLARYRTLRNIFTVTDAMNEIVSSTELREHIEEVLSNAGVDAQTLPLLLDSYNELREQYYVFIELVDKMAEKIVMDRVVNEETAHMDDALRKIIEEQEAQ